jgi:hypothetical protein
MAETKNAQTPDPKSNPSPKPSPKPNLSALPFLSNANDLPFLGKSQVTTLPEVTVTSTKKKPNLGSLMKRIKTAQDATDAELNALGQYATRNTKYNREFINKPPAPIAPNTIANTREYVEADRAEKADKVARLKYADENDALDNTIEAYIKSQEKFGQNFSTAFNPVTKKFEDVDPLNHPDIIKKRQELRYGLDTGQYEMDKDELTGRPILFSNNDNIISGFLKALDKSAAGTADVTSFPKLSTEEKVKQIKYEDAVGLPYLPQKASGAAKISEFLGNVTLPLFKAAALGVGSKTIGMFNPSLGASMTVEAAANLNKLGQTISFIDDMTSANATSAIKRHYNFLIKNNPTMDPIVAMKQAENMEAVGAATGAGEAILMGSTFSKLSAFKGITDAASKINTTAFLKSMANVTKEATKQGGIAASGAVTRDVVSNLAGADIPVESTFDEGINRFDEMFKMAFTFGATPLAAKGIKIAAENIPVIKEVNAQNIRYAIAVSTGAIKGISPSVMHQAKMISYDLPSVEVEALIKAGETEGVYEQGTLEKYKTEKELFDETDNQVPTDIPKEKRDITVSYTHLRAHETG